MRVTLRTVEYEDPEGRKWLRGLPDGTPDTQAAIGVPQGPPPLTSLGLPLAIEVRLHNQLYARGVLTERDARSKLPDIQSALSAALRVDVHEILKVYQGAIDGS